MPGEVPTGWTGTTLGALFSWSSGRKPPFAIGTDGPIPVFGSNGILGFGPEANVARAYLIGRVGASGSLHTVRATAWANDNTLVAEPSDGQADFAFLGFVLGAANLPSLATKTAQPLLTQSNLRPVPVFLPPLPEQKKIAAILSSVDEAIQATQLVIDQTRRVKEGLLQDLLTRGVPGHTRFKQTEIGEIPQSWEVRELQEVCREKVTYGIVQCGPHIEDGVPYIRVSDMEHAELRVARMLRTSPEIAAKFTRSTVETGDVVYALRGKIGEVRLVHDEVAGANLTQGTARLSPAWCVSPEFLLWAMRSPATMRQAELVAKGSTFREITLDRLRKIRIPVPPRREQDAIVERVRSADESAQAGSTALATLNRTKAGLLQDLLTGKVRVSP